jgi:hypothetical protein
VESNAAAAKTNARVAMDSFIGILQCSVPRNPGSPRFTLA